MQVPSRLIVAASVAIALAMGSGAALAGLGQPSPWQMNFQQSASPVMDWVIGFHDGLLVVITCITAFVLVLLLIVIVRFNRGANPQPSRTTHNTLVEVAWTVVPIVILTAIAIPSFKLLFYEQTIPPADLTLKATGYQWYWAYAYPDQKLEFESRMLSEEDRKRDKAGEPRLLAVDHEIEVPVNKVVHVQVTADPMSVIHSFTVPSFGVKIDAVPGRLNDTWFKATREGIYYGQCSELCGKDHAFMPIAVRVVSDQEFAAWLESTKNASWATQANNENPRHDAASTEVAAVSAKAE